MGTIEVALHEPGLILPYGETLQQGRGAVCKLGVASQFETTVQHAAAPVPVIRVGTLFHPACPQPGMKLCGGIRLVVVETPHINVPLTRISGAVAQFAEAFGDARNMRENSKGIGAAPAPVRDHPIGVGKQAGVYQRASGMTDRGSTVGAWKAHAARREAVCMGRACGSACVAVDVGLCAVQQDEEEIGGL